MDGAPTSTLRQVSGGTTQSSQLPEIPKTNGMTCESDPYANRRLNTWNAAYLCPDGSRALIRAHIDPVIKHCFRIFGLHAERFVGFYGQLKSSKPSENDQSMAVRAWSAIWLSLQVVVRTCPKSVTSCVAATTSSPRSEVPIVRS